MRLGGQLRVVSGMTVRVLGWDMNAALSMGAALGIQPMAIAEFLPEIERVAVAKMNDGLGEPTDV